jgi:hypothetical protein
VINECPTRCAPIINNGNGNGNGNGYGNDNDNSKYRSSVSADPSPKENDPHSPHTGVAVFKPEAPLIFLTAPAFVQRIAATLQRRCATSDNSASDSAPFLGIVVDFSSVPYVDSCFLECFCETLDDCKDAGVILALSSLNNSVLYRMELAGIILDVNRQRGRRREMSSGDKEPHTTQQHERVEEQWAFISTTEAVEAILAHAQQGKGLTAIPSGEGLVTASRDLELMDSNFPQRTLDALATYGDRGSILQAGGNKFALEDGDGSSMVIHV